MADEVKQAPADWYPDPDTPGGQRYWDGEQWTEDRRPASGQAASPAANESALVSERKTKKGEERIYQGSQQRLFQATMRAVGELGYTVSHTDAASGTVAFNSGRSMKSWAGQDISVIVMPEGTGQAKVVVGGSLATRGNPFGGGSQLASWGEKKQVTKKFFAMLEQVLPDIAEPQVASPQSQPGSSTTDELSRLAELHEKGALTDDEFRAAKARLLS